MRESGLAGLPNHLGRLEEERAQERPRLLLYCHEAAGLVFLDLRAGRGIGRGWTGGAGQTCVRVQLPSPSSRGEDSRSYPPSHCRLDIVTGVFIVILVVR
jgi:hypothetical protein